MFALAFGFLPIESGLADKVWIGSQARGDEGGIYLAELNPESGELSGLKQVVKLGGAGFQALSADGKRLYSTCGMDGGEGGVAAFRVKDDGTLEELNRQSSGGKGLCFVGLDASGRCALVVSYGGGTAASFPIGGDGAVGEVASFHQHAGSGPNEKRQKGPHAHSIYAGPDNRFAYAPDLGIDKVMIYRLDAKAGKIEASGAAGVPPGSGPRHMKFGRDGSHAYVLNELTLTVSVFERNAGSGELKEEQVVSVLAEGGDVEGMSCSEIRVSKDGRYVYTANRDVVDKGRDSVSVLSIGKDGSLKHLQTVPAEVSIPRNIGLSPDGKWLLVCGQKSNDVAVLKVDPASGKMSSAGHKVAVGAPMCVSFR